MRNYFRITIRNFLRQPGYSFINVAGLATGMAAFVLIGLFVQNELSFDRHNPNRDDVYRVVLDAEVQGQSILTVSSPAVMAGAFIESFPEVVDATRINTYSTDLLFTVGDRPFYESQYFAADSSVFSIFDIELLEGDPATALNRPNTLVLSESVARKYFGDEPAIGQSVRLDNRTDYEVTGVMVDPTGASHFRPRLIGSFLSLSSWNSPVWLNNSYATYVQLRPGADPDVLQSKFPDFVRANVGPQIQQFMGQDFDVAIAAGFRYDWVLEQLGDIYLHSRAEDQIGPTGDIRYLYILGIIAAFVLLIACINFMNLATARATGRAREVGVRKVMGSNRGQLIRQFLGESTVMSIIAMVLASVLVLLALPVFSKLAGADLRLHLWLVGAMLATAIVTGLIAGAYPAFVLSSFNPATVMKGSFARSRRGTMLRSVLVVSQFTITIVLLVGTSVVFKQLRFIQSQDLGFEPTQVVVVPIETRNGVETFDTFRSELLTHAAIVDAGASGILPGPGRIHNNTGFRGENQTENEMFIAGLGEVSDDYVETLGLEIVAGRDFDPAFSADSASWVINEAAARELGWTPDEAIGKRVMRLDEGAGRLGTVVGVTADAHYTSLHQAVQPIIFGNWNTNQRYGAIRVRGDQMNAALAHIEAKWTAFEPGYPFRYFFMDADYQQFYDREQRLGKLYLAFTILAVIIACLGLFGLASFRHRAAHAGDRRTQGAWCVGVGYRGVVVARVHRARAYSVRYRVSDCLVRDDAVAGDVCVRHVDWLGRVCCIGSTRACRSVADGELPVNPRGAC